MHELEAETRGFDPKSYERGRNFMRSLMGREHTLNERDRKRALRRQKELMNSTKLVIPKNYYYCMLIIDMLWPTEIPARDLKMRTKTSEDLEMDFVFGDTDPMHYATIREHTLRAKCCKSGRPNDCPKRVRRDWEEFVEKEELSEMGWMKMYNADEIYPKEWVKYILERVFDCKSLLFTCLWKSYDANTILTSGG